MDIPVGKNIQRLRVHRGWTQEVLCDFAEVSVRWLSKVESGESGMNIRLDYLARVADALGCELVELLKGEDGATLRPRVARGGVRRAQVRRQSAIRARVEELSTRWGTVIGRLTFPWVVVSYGPYLPEHIESHFVPEEPAYPPEIEEEFRRLHEDIGRRAVVGDEVPYDSENFKLVRFHVSSRAGRLELPKLVLHFVPTTYFRMLSTNQRLDVPLTTGGRTYTLRARYAADVDLRTAPVPEFATYWGVGLSVITSDGMLLLSERGNTAVEPNAYSPAVAEISLRASDTNGRGAPDHFSTARRGLREELGVDLEPDEITWLSFGANSYTCGYALLGRVDTRHTLHEVQSRHSVGAAKDSWETKRIHAVEFGPVEVARFCSEPSRRFAPITVASIVHTLMHEFGVARVEAALGDASISVTQTLPAWLERGEAG